MTDYDYAALIYDNLYFSNKSMNVQGVLNAIKLLEERKQQALEYYYRDGMSYKQAGEKMGVSANTAKYHTENAMCILRHPYNSNNMHREERRQVV